MRSREGSSQCKKEAKKRKIGKQVGEKLDGEEEEEEKKRRE